MDPSILVFGVMIGVGIAVLAFRFWVPRSRWGHVRRDALEQLRFEGAADALGMSLTFAPSAKRASIAGAWEGLTARISYEWRFTDELGKNAHRDTTRRDVIARTRVEVPIRGLPEGFSVRDRSVVDLVAGGDRVPLEDPALEEAFVAEGPADAVAACFAKPELRASLLAVRAFGTFELDSTRIALQIPSLVLEAAVLAPLLDAVVQVARAVGAQSPTPVPVKRAPSLGSPSPKPLRPSLAALVVGARRGTDVRASARAADELASRPCRFELEIQRVTAATGVGDGVGTVTLHGTVARGTSRVSARFPGGLGLLARAYGPGERVECEGYIEHFDFVSDQLEVTCDVAPVAVGGAPVELLPADLPLTGVVARLQANAALRVSALAGLAGKPHAVSFRMTAVRPSNPFRVPAILKGGMTATGLVDDSAVAVDLRLPEGAPAFVGATITVTVAIAGWDEVENRLLLDAVPVGGA